MDDDDDEDMGSEADDLISATRKNLNYDSDDTENIRNKMKNKNHREGEVERLMQLKKDTQKRKDKFKDRIIDLIDGE